MTKSALQQLQESITQTFGVRPARRPVMRAVMAERGRSSAALAKARKLAALHNIHIEKEDASAYWVTCGAFANPEDDPLEGSHFCSDGIEVLQAVEVYVDALKAA